MTKQTNGFAKATLTTENGRILDHEEKLTVGQTYRLVITFTPQSTLPQLDPTTQVQVIPFSGEVVGIIMCQGFALEREAFVLRVNKSVGEISLPIVADDHVDQFSFTIELLHKNVPISTLKLNRHLST